MQGDGLDGLAVVRRESKQQRPSPRGSWVARNEGATKLCDVSAIIRGGCHVKLTKGGSVLHCQREGSCAIREREFDVTLALTKNNQPTPCKSTTTSYRRRMAQPASPMKCRW